MPSKAQMILSQKAASLSAALPTTPAQPAAEEQPRPAAKRRKKNGVTGKRAHFWKSDEDERLIRELAVYLASQNERTNDSLIIRAALRAARPDKSLLSAYREAMQEDRRLKQHRDE